MATGTPRQMKLVGFMQASNVSVYAGSWLHPDSSPDFLTAGYYQHIGRVLEDGCFDMLFFDDRLAILENPTIRDLSALGQVLSPPENGSGVAGRPRWPRKSPSGRGDRARRW